MTWQTSAAVFLKREKIRSHSAEANRDAGQPQRLHLPKAGPRTQQQLTQAPFSHPPKYFPLEIQQHCYTSHSLLPGQPGLLGKLLCRLLNQETPLLWLRGRSTMAGGVSQPPPQSLLPHAVGQVWRAALSPQSPTAFYLLAPESRLLTPGVFQGEKASKRWTPDASVLCRAFMQFPCRNHSRLFVPQSFWDLCGTIYLKL